MKNKARYFEKITTSIIIIAIVVALSITWYMGINWGGKGVNVSLILAFSITFAVPITLFIIIAIHKFHKETHRKVLAAITIVYIVVLFMMLCWLHVSVTVDLPGPHPAPYIELELYQQDDSANRIVWVVKNITRGGVWEDIWGKLYYSNGTAVDYNHYHTGGATIHSINNSSLQLPTGKIKVGDLITVNAPWDGDAWFMLIYRPYGTPIAEASTIHY